jgi:hypothetical protein
VECDFAGPGLKVVKEGEAPAISGSYGKGGPMIRLSTDYGAIRLLHAGVRPPAPPKPPEHPGEGETTWNPPAVPPVAPAVCVVRVDCAPPRGSVVRFAEHIWRLETHLLSALFHINLNNGWARPRIVVAGF